MSEVLRLGAEVVQGAPGREAELAALLREYDEARTTQHTRVVVVRGPAGVGKSFLSLRLLAAAGRRGAPVFEGGSGRDGQRPWGLVAPLVSPMLEHLTRSGVPEAVVAELAGVLGVLRDGSG